jgi:hypothetical protein
MTGFVSFDEKFKANLFQWLRGGLSSNSAFAKMLLTTKYFDEH